MDADEILEATDKEELREKKSSRLKTEVAVAVALLATFLGICNVKDGNIVQAMEQAQAEKIDNYGWYQAKKTRLEFMAAEVDQLKLQAANKVGTEKDAYEALAAKVEKDIEAKTAELDDVKKKADDAVKDYDAWNAHDDQFDLCEGAISIAIALFAVTALTEKKWLFWIATVPAVTGVIFGIAGFAGWNLRLEWVMKFLGT